MAMESRQMLDIQREAEVMQMVWLQASRPKALGFTPGAQQSSGPGLGGPLGASKQAGYHEDVDL